MKRRRRSRSTDAAIVGVACLSIGGAAQHARAATAQAYEVQVDVKSPAGEDLGKRRITTPIDVEASIEWMHDELYVRLTVKVARATDPGCEQVSLRLERREPALPTKETLAKVIVCGENPVRFDGGELGAPSMTVTLRPLTP
jgi:hypothetical protein